MGGPSTAIFLLFVGLTYQGKDIVFRFIIEYNKYLNGFWPLSNNSLFLYEHFGKMIFWLVLILEISYRVMISS